MKIKSLTTVKEMWDEVKKDATSKSTLYLVDAEHQLKGMRLTELSDPKSHLAELKSHFQLMMSRYNNLMEMGSLFFEQKFITLLTSSLPNSYHPALQTLTAADRAAKLKPSSTTLAAPSQTVTAMLTGMSSHELMDYFIEEAEHHLIEDTQAKQTESAMHAQSKKKRARKIKENRTSTVKTVTSPGMSKTTAGHQVVEKRVKAQNKRKRGLKIRRKISQQ